MKLGFVDRRRAPLRRTLLRQPENPRSPLDIRFGLPDMITQAARLVLLTGTLRFAQSESRLIAQILWQAMR